MITLDLKNGIVYPPLAAKSAAELFDFGVALASVLDDIRVRCPTGDAPEEAVVLDSKLLHKKGVQVF